MALTDFQELRTWNSGKRLECGPIIYSSFRHPFYCRLLAKDLFTGIRFAIYVKHRPFSSCIRFQCPPSDRSRSETFLVIWSAMFRPASRSILRSAQSSLAPARTTATRRFLSTVPPNQRSRGWKSSAARWGLAMAAIYYYNTSELFAEQPAGCKYDCRRGTSQSVDQSDTSLVHLDPKADYEDSNTSSLDGITQSSPEKKARQQSVLASIASEDNRTPSTASSAVSQPESEPSSTPSASDPAGLEDEASSEGAFNPTTGEINWDCPCLGGMAHGPCGEEFRAAFSCFVFSEEEPKGMDCIDKFQGMQNCFRAHPDVYAAELEGDDDEQLEEGLEEERKELVKEIKERREKAGTAAAADPAQRKRLLEDDPPMERKPLLRRAQAPPTPPPTAPPSSSEPHPPMSENHEAGARLQAKAPQAKRQPESNPDKASQSEVFDKDLELVPKEWPIPDKKTEN